MKTNTRKLCEAGIILAILLVSQIFKGVSVYITGPIVNACLILATLLIDRRYGILLSIIAPVTSFIITGTPIISAVPIVMPLIMIGNIILCVMTDLFYDRKSNKKLIAGLASGSVLKGIFMGGTIVIAISRTITEAHPLFKMLPVFKMTFSVTQLVTALIGSVIAYLIYFPIKKYVDTLHNGETK